ncbi:MAG: AAA family ATPase, partial [Thaumarchaeota archaeon]|nr:AAA family ATPase [Nitrososphaerota archaeon]
MPIEVQPPISRPSALAVPDSVEALSSSDDVLVGIDSLLSELKSHLSHMSSVLLTGALGSGKTSVAKLMARRLREDHLCHTTYFPCRKLVNDESRIATVRETLNRVFMEASWGARLGGKSLVILDDLDRLCPAEQELQVGNDNGRSRQISEAICAIVRQYCGRDSNVVLLASCVGKDTLHHVLVGGHVVREIVELKAPDKEGRRKIMEFIAQQHAAPAVESEAVPPISNGSRPTTADGSAAGDDGNAWMDGSQPSRRHSVSNTGGFVLQPDLDFLDLAGKTDGYVPGDLNLLLARARNEALMRSVNELPFESESEAVPLAKIDFDQALKGFTPASLRNVTLQSSATTFGSVGGLQETRRILLETLEYPTK